MKTPEIEGRKVTPVEKQTELAVVHAKFKEIYPTEDDCRKAIFRVLRESGSSQCPTCGNKDFDADCPARMVLCTVCMQPWWITSNTFFDRVKKFEPWLTAIWMLENGVEINAMDLFRMLDDIAYSTAYSLISEIEKALAGMMESNAIDSTSSSQVSGPCVGRTRRTEGRTRRTEGRTRKTEGRTRETAAGRPSREEKEFEVVHQPDAVSQIDFDAALNAWKGNGYEQYMENARKVLDVLGDLPIDFDDIAEATGISASDAANALSVLELEKLIDREQGGFYRLVDSAGAGR